MTSKPPVHDDQELADLQRRAAQHTEKPSDDSLRTRLKTTLTGLRQALQGRIPQRYLFHISVLLLLPLALLAGRYRPTQQPQQPPALAFDREGHPLSPGELRPIALGLTADPLITVAMVPKAKTAPAPLDEMALLAAAMRQERRTMLLIPSGPPDYMPLPSTVTADKANLRSGPGTAFDKIDQLVLGDAINALARHEDWLQVETSAGTQGWIAAELVGLVEQELDFIPQAQDVPTPPPPLIAEVAAETLNLRDGPSTEYVGMAKLEDGATLDLLARHEDWFQVQTEEGARGWVTAEYLAVVPGVVERVPETEDVPPINPALVGVVMESGVNLRKGPSTSFESLGKLEDGVELALLAQYKTWYKVETPRGTIGWISADLLSVSSFIDRRVPLTDDIPSLPKPAPKAPAPSTPRETRPAPIPAGDAGSVVAFAMQFQGYPYVWGAEGPNAFDCSGFTQYVYKQFGLYLPHSSAAQYSSQYGAFIFDKESLAPGDLVFFANTYKRGISHVGIYIGGGNVIQGISERYGVGVSSLYEAYWSSKYYGAVRPYR